MKYDNSREKELKALLLEARESFRQGVVNYRLCERIDAIESGDVPPPITT